MFIQMLKNQRVTFVNNRDEAERFSPFHMWYNNNSSKWVVSKQQHPRVGSHMGEPVATGLTEEEAIACVMFKANEYIYRGLQK